MVIVEHIPMRHAMCFLLIDLSQKLSAHEEINLVDSC
jgi:hypothetical protein